MPSSESRALLDLLMCGPVYTIRDLRPFKGSRTYVVPAEVWVVFLNAVVQDGDHHTATGESLCPGLFGVQILVSWVGLKSKTHTEKEQSQYNMLL